MFYPRNIHSILKQTLQHSKKMSGIRLQLHVDSKGGSDGFATNGTKISLSIAMGTWAPVLKSKFFGAFKTHADVATFSKRSVFFALCTNDTKSCAKLMLIGG